VTTTTAPPATSTLARAGVAVGVLACLVIAAIDLFAHTASSGRFVGAADFWYTADLFPFVLGPLLLLIAARRVQGGRDRRLGTSGFVLTALGLLGFLPCGVAALITRDPMALGPVYMLSMLATMAGLALSAIAMIRARVLPRWAGPVLLAGWLIGGPVGDGGPLGFPASALLLAAALIAVGISIERARPASYGGARPRMRE
jgi:hypothetical protein